ncbi:hypothetical protein F5984_11110 [Rudanella paleaurantiibacter]|jgi:hypothetical protein|uniref:Uncharacterized protein n=1 Tax=Rudanella paleaurantiibacter TaxID=2614655 RepID=A0A7J5U0R4_9BACT|nr:MULTISPECIES: hypothetical protein [Rudanella]KAB7731338.1 hypothetical protein F5984_11110 [Rudanella paleaurantiibacter]
MQKPDSSYLMEQLIHNRLSVDELNQLLAGLHHPDDLQAYSDVLETFFKTLIEQQGPPPAPTQTTG